MLRRNKKRLLALLLAALMGLSFTACAASGAAVPTLETSGAESDAPPAEKDPADYDRDIQGLTAFLEDSALVTGDRVQMSYDVIGAKNGYKYNYIYNGSAVQLEVYEFDPENLPEAAQKAQATLRENGTFDVLGRTVSGTLSTDGQFLLVYTDTKDSAENTAHKERVEARFNAFAEYGIAR